MRELNVDNLLINVYRRFETERQLLPAMISCNMRTSHMENYTVFASEPLTRYPVVLLTLALFKFIADFQLVGSRKWKA